LLGLAGWQELDHQPSSSHKIAIPEVQIELRVVVGACVFENSVRGLRSKQEAVGIELWLSKKMISPAGYTALSSGFCRNLHSPSLSLSFVLRVEHATIDLRHHMLTSLC
jgi:hypothetical protein